LKDLSLHGLPLAKGTVTGGCKIIDTLLTPIVEEIINHCRGANLWNADETTWRVFGEEKRKWWFWIIASDDAIAYFLDPSRSKKVPSDFFAGSVGTLMTDRYSSYKSLHQGIRKAWCIVHLRRDILNVYNGIPRLKSWAKSWLLDIATLFILNDNRVKLWKKDVTTGSEWDKAVKELEAHVQMLKERWEKELKQPKLHKEQSKILRSMKRHWPGYTMFLEDPRIPLHNNRAERLLRNTVILRKNSFGSGSPWAGHLASKVFSIFQTWLINGLDPKALLLDYFNECSKTPGKPPQDVSPFLPWSMSDERKRRFALPESYERPG
jgi:transposase